MRAIDERLKAEVLASLITGLGVRDTARKYQLSPATVSRLKSEMSGQLEQIGTDTRDEIGTILHSHVLANISGLNRITKQTENNGWISLQSAEGLAKLYGEIADHTIRLLEAASAVQPDAKTD